MSRRKTPNNVHNLNGSFRNDRHGGGKEVAIPEGYPEVPEFLKDYAPALRVWDSIKVVMESSNIYTAADALILARYCQMQAEFQACPAKYTAAEKRELRALESQLYLNPESRARLGIKKKDSTNPFDKFK